MSNSPPSSIPTYSEYMGVNEELYGKLYRDNFAPHKNLEVTSTLEHQIIGNTYIFFTKPDLNFSDENINSLYLNSNPLSEWLKENLSAKRKKSFIPILSNMSKNIEFKDHKQHSSIFIGDATKQGIEIPMNFSGKSSGTFSVNYVDIRGLYVLRLHELWFNYIKYAQMGKVDRTKYNKRNSVLDFMASAYVFVMEADGMTIASWGKYTGIYPNNIPYASLNNEDRTHKPTEFSIEYTFAYDEMNTTDVLYDFALLCSRQMRAIANVDDDMSSIVVESSEKEGSTRPRNSKANETLDVFDINKLKSRHSGKSDGGGTTPLPFNYNAEFMRTYDKRYKRQKHLKGYQRFLLSATPALVKYKNHNDIKYKMMFI